ncbi:MAG: diguanylate cyclase [Pseudomonadota bacterium]
MKRPSALVPVIAGFSVMLLLMAAVTAIGVTYVRILSDQLTAIVAERNQKAELATAMHALHEGRYQALMLATSLQDPFARDEEILRFSRMAQDFMLLRDKFLALPLDDAELELWQGIRTDVRSVEIGVDQAIDLLHADELEAARTLIRRQVLPAQESMMRKWGSLVDLQRKKNQEAMDEARHASSNASQLTLGLSAGAFLVGLVIAGFVIRLSRRLENALFQEKEMAQVTLHAIGDAVIRFDDKASLAYLNPVAEQLLGLQAGSVRHYPLDTVLRLQDKTDRTELTTQLVTSVLQGNHESIPFGATLISGPGMEFDVEGSCAPIHTHGGDIIGGVLVLRDVTEDRELHRKLIWQADHDALTGLLNRRAFEARLSQSLVSKRAGEFPLSVLYIDLDRFKPVNDTAGHAAGDELLRRISAIMQARIRDTDTLARMGGDEFAIVLSACPDAMAEEIAQQIRADIRQFHFAWENHTFQVGASIGIVHVPPHWASLDDCLVAADAACYKAKQGGRNQVAVHNRSAEAA